MNKLYVLLLVASLFLSSNLHANIEEECTGEASYTEKCRYFFKGYLYGLSESRGSILKEESKSISLEETFSERAIRTRLGVGGLRQPKVKSKPLYCLPNLKVAAASIAENLQREFSENAEFWVEADDPIGKALQKIYPCKN